MKKLIAIACVLSLILAGMIALLVRGKNRGTGTETTTTLPTQTTTTTTVPVTTTRLPQKTSTAANTSEILVNIPLENEMAKDALSQLQQLCRSYGSQISFTYIDLASGYSIEYRADRSYQAASVIKAPYVKWLLTEGVDGSEKLTMTSGDKQGGSGIVDKEPAGTQFTVNELMEYAVRYSDNTAYYMLNKKFGFKGFNDYASKLGSTANANSHCVLSFPRPRFGYLSARDIALYMQDIAKFIETDTADAKRLKGWMMSTSEERQLTDAFSAANVLYGLAADAPVDFEHEVAHKYGDTKNIENAFHDGAIVYAEHPFVLSVATSLEPFSPKSIEIFHELAFQINKIQHAYYAK